MRVEFLTQFRFFRYASLLPKPSLEKERLIIIGFSDENPEKFSPLKTIRILFSLMDIESHLHPFASGWRIIINTKGISFGHFMKVIAHLGLLKKAIYYVQVKKSMFTVHLCCHI